MAEEAKGRGEDRMGVDEGETPGGGQETGGAASSASANGKCTLSLV